jgi:tetratricopeptide (TPR) repeat protein
MPALRLALKNSLVLLKSMSSSSRRPPLLVRMRYARRRLVRRLANAGAALVAPFERILGRVTRRLFAVTERFEGIDSLVLGIGRALTWPVRASWRLMSAAIGLLPTSARNVLTAPFRLSRFLVRWISVAFIRFAEAINLDGVIWRLVKWTRPLWYPFAAVLGFVSAWLATRDYKQLLWGLPVLLALLPLAAIAGWTLIRGNDGIAAQYRLAVKEAREKKDYERVELFERKLAQLGVATELTDYQTALALAQDGELSKAYERMQKLAPIDKPGYLPAHYWIAIQLLTNKLEMPAPERHKLARTHLDHLQSLGVKGFEFDLMRAFSLQSEKKLDEAAKLLEPYAGRHPQAAMMRMEINASLERLGEARSDARLVRTHMQDRTRREENLTAQDYAAWTIAESILGDTAQAHELAQKWSTLAPDNMVARQILLEQKLRLFDSMLRLPEPDVHEMATLFVQAAQLNDKPQVLQRQLASLYRLRSQSPAVERVVDAVVNLPETPATLLEAAGTVAATVGDSVKAKEYLQRAVKKDAGNAVAWNNYAWIVAQEPNGDLDDALAAVNKALELSPNEFRFRETRGQILVRLGRWQSAVADLEVAVNGMPDSADIHRALAQAYDALGDKQLASVHQEHAARSLTSR